MRIEVLGTDEMRLQRIGGHRRTSLLQSIAMRGLLQAAEGCQGNRRDKRRCAAI
jgi:hypothetical protein